MLAWAYLAVSVVCAAEILYDIRVRGWRQTMPVMEWVWPITALYLGPLATWAYRRWGRASTTRAIDANGGEMQEKPFWAQVAVGVGHCGGGCTLGDIIAETLIFVTAITLLGEAFFAEVIGDYALALGLGLAFQYFAIAPMRGLGLRDGLKAAAKADVLSLTAFEVGLFAWMALMAFVFFPDPHLRPDRAAYWFLMQIGMALGFLTAYPMNWWLIRRGIKEAM